MGAVADAALAGGAEVIGVIPAALDREEVSHQRLADLRVVPDMHARKALQAELADAFVACPGGYGTLEEIVEMLTWAQLKIHSKPCALFNVNGYFDHLLGFFDMALSEGYLKPQHREMLIVESNAGRLLDSFISYQAPVVDKWIDRSKGGGGS